MKASFAQTALAIYAALAIGGCAPVAPVEAAEPAGDTCQAAPGQRFIGMRASDQLAADMLAATNSREIRWVPPGMMVTMDYKFGRLTVSYDAQMIVTQVSCG